MQVKLKDKTQRVGTLSLITSLVTVKGAEPMTGKAFAGTNWTKRPKDCCVAEAKVHLRISGMVLTK